MARSITIGSDGGIKRSTGFSSDKYYSNDNIQKRKSSSSKSSSSSSKDDYEKDLRDRVDQIAEAKREAQIAALTKTRDQRLAQLAEQEEAIEPRYKQLRSAASGRSQVQAKNLAEYAANRGVATSGSTLQRELQRTAALRGEQADIGLRETQARQDIDRREDLVESAYSSDVASAKSQAEIGRLESQLAADDKIYQREQQEFENDLKRYTFNQAKIADLVERRYGDLAQGMLDWIDNGGTTSDPEYLAMQTARKNKIQEQQEDRFNNRYNRLKLEKTEQDLEYSELRNKLKEKEIKSFDDVKDLEKKLLETKNEEDIREELEDLKENEKKIYNDILQDAVKQAERDPRYKNLIDSGTLETEDGIPASNVKEALIMEYFNTIAARRGEQGFVLGNPYSRLEKETQEKIQKTETSETSETSNTTNLSEDEYMKAFN